MEVLDYLKAKTSEESEDILKACILDAEDEIKSYINQKIVPITLQGLVRKLALFYYNRLGVEGSLSHSEGGISDSFINDLSKDDLSRLNHHRIFEIGGYPKETDDETES